MTDNNFAETDALEEGIEEETEEYRRIVFDYEHLDDAKTISGMLGMEYEPSEEEEEERRRIIFDYEHRDDEKTLTAMYGGAEGLANLRCLTKDEIIASRREQIMYRLARPEQYGKFSGDIDRRDLEALEAWEAGERAHLVYRLAHPEMFGLGREEDLKALEALDALEARDD